MTSGAIKLASKPKLEVAGLQHGWRIYNYLSKPKLLSGCHGAPWIGRTLTARCNWPALEGLGPLTKRQFRKVARRQAREHLLRHLDNDGYGPCSCGIYAFTDDAFLNGRGEYEYGAVPSRPTYGDVIAAVIGYGAVALAPDGWIAESVRIEHLWVGPNLAAGDIFYGDGIVDVETAVGHLAKRYKVPVEIGEPRATVDLYGNLEGGIRDGTNRANYQGSNGA